LHAANRVPRQILFDDEPQNFEVPHLRSLFRDALVKNDAAVEENLNEVQVTSFGGENSRICGLN
jgi:hypothetical protein